MSTPVQEAEAYFAALWAQWEPRWRAGDISPARMRNGTTDPVDYCLSTVALVERQPGDAAYAVRLIRQELMEAAKGQFFYLPESTHITLLGCTQRAATPAAFSVAHIQRITAICQQELYRVAPVEMTLKGVGVIGNQVFVQVFPYDRQWAMLRQQLVDALVAEGEQPLTHANKAPIHLNLMRITDARPDALRHIIEVIRPLRDRAISTFTVTTVDLLLTDFVVSPSHTTFVASYALNHQPA